MLTSVVKKAILNLRLKPEIRDEFAIAAELRGASMSGLLHQFIVRTIREEKEQSPQSFKKAEPTVNGSNVKPVEGHRSNDRLEPVPDDQVAYVRNLGELTDERKQKPVKKRAGKNK
jgi:hypothetical protein